MSRVVFLSRHKSFQPGFPGGGSVFSLPCSGDVPDFIRYSQGSLTETCTLIGNPPATSTDTSQIGDTIQVSGGTFATVHGANSNLTLSNRGCRARYDYYFWQSNDIWTYDSRIETSGIQDTFSTWKVAATPVAATLEGTTLGLYPMLIPESGIKGKVQPHIVTAAFNGSTVVLIKKNLITNTWTSGNIGTLTNPGAQRIPISELFHNNKIYFITDQSAGVAVLDPVLETVQETAWPQAVTHPMDLNVFTGRVYCLNKDVANSGHAIWEIDAVTGPSKRIQLATGYDAAGMTTNNFAGRSMLFSSYVGNFLLGNDAENRPIPHMVAMQWASLSGGIKPGIWPYIVAPTGGGGLTIPLEASGPLIPLTLADEWNPNDQSGDFFRPGVASANVQNTEDNVWRCWIDDMFNAPGGSENVEIIFRENPDDGAVFRNYRYKNNPQENQFTLVGPVYQSGQFNTGKHHFSYTTHKFGGGHYDAGAWKPDITVSGLEITSQRHNRVWFIVDGDFLHPENHEVKVTLLYGGTGDRLSSPHTNIGTLSAAGRGTLVANTTNYQTIQSGVPQYVDWNGFDDGFVEGDRVNFVLLVETTGNAPASFNKKMSFVNYLNVGAPQETTSTGPDTHGQFFNVTDRDISSTGPDIRQQFFNVDNPGQSSTGPQGAGIFFNVTFDSSSTGPIASASGIFTLAPPQVPGQTQPLVIWWGFRASQGNISGFGRSQGR